MVERGGDLPQARFPAQARAHPLGEAGVRVQAGAGAGAAQRDLAHVHERVSNPLAPQRDLRRVAGELLTERDGRRVHHVRAAGLDDAFERSGLARERPFELRQRGEKLVLGDVERGELHRGGEDVVGGLPHVDVVVGMDIAARKPGDHLVGVHVRRRPRAGLKDVDRELVVVLARDDLRRRALDAPGLALGQQAELGVDAGRGALQPRQPPHDRQGHRLAGDGEVLHGLGCLRTPQLAALAHAGHYHLPAVAPRAAGATAAPRCAHPGAPEVRRRRA